MLNTYTTRGPKSVAVPRALERLRDMPQLRGLRFVLGWQKDRMMRQIPVHISCTWLGFSVIWLCVLLWKGEIGDWGAAFGFAQVVAASITLVIMLTRV